MIPALNLVSKWIRDHQETEESNFQLTTFIPKVIKKQLQTLVHPNTGSRAQGHSH